jgi:alkanesulfonate monooxygenase SsuD/methylene tetrahydromethanopterin reductase-like flavin-dependent oxidoreductase (luciferase family)
MSSWPAVVAAAREAEALGFESVWMGDRTGLDPLVALAALARITRRVGLGTLVLSAGRRPATVLAKALATLDVVSAGRLIAGVGGGDAALLAETVAVLDGMWRGGPFAFDGAHERAVHAYCLPRPVQRPRPPIWLSGTGVPVLNLVAAGADGWIAPWNQLGEDYTRDARALDRACEQVGRDPASVTRLLPVTVPVGTVEDVREQLRGWAARGVSTLVLEPASAPSAAAGREDMARIAVAASLDPDAEHRTP